MTPKVFCIGFHKTGTTSLTAALTRLDYHVTGPNGIKDPDIEKNVIDMAHQLVPKFDAFQDNPWPVIYQELDQHYPNSKFILTLRDPDSWIKSQVKHFGKEVTPMRQWIYGAGCPEGNEEIYLNRFNQHYAEVHEYFKHRPDDLLIMDLRQGDGWGKLCSFLCKDAPTSSFPHSNKASDRDRDSENRTTTDNSKAKKIITRWIRSIEKRIN